MHFFLKIAAWLFHPLFIGIYGVLLYFSVTPRFVQPEIVYGKLLVVFILTFLIPILFFFILRNLNWVQSIELHSVNERKAPLMILAVLLLLMLRVVFDFYSYPELYYYFLGMLFTVITAWILVLFKFKASLHMMGVSGLSMYAIALSIHFNINILMTIAFLLFACGWVASSRLHTKSHTSIELIIGFFIGWIPQLLLVNYWM
jgi:membrane-associated HD superfamily phosphohydrolase